MEKEFYANKKYLEMAGEWNSVHWLSYHLFSGPDRSCLASVAGVDHWCSSYLPSIEPLAMGESCHSTLL